MGKVYYDVDKIKAARLTKGWTQTELGFRVGVSETGINHLEKHRRGVGPAMMKKLAKVLGLSMRSLVVVVPDEEERELAGTGK